MRVEHLLRRYGSRIDELLALIAERPDLAEPLEGADDYLRVEVVYAASHEGALHLDDVLARRTRISIETFHRGVQSADEAAALMGEVLGWSSRRGRCARSRTTTRASRPSGNSQKEPEDKGADAVRTSAPDLLRDITPVG